MIKKITEYLKIHWKVVVVLVLSYLFLDKPWALFQTVLIIAGFEMFALEVYEYIIRFTISNNFLKNLFDGEDTKFSIMETVGFSQFQAAALLSAHLLVGIVAYAVYFIQFAP